MTNKKTEKKIDKGRREETEREKKWKRETCAFDV